MAKIPFDIKFRPQIVSGEYKVIDRFGYVLTLRDIINDVWYFSLCYPNTDYETERVYDHPENHLFLVTPEPELSEFEERIFKLLRQYKEFDIPLTPENIKAEASMLWPDFEKYFFDLYGKEGEGDSALRSFYYRGLADGKAEALKDLPRWRKWGSGACGNGIGNPIAIVKRWINDYKLVDALGIQGERYIMLSDLEKLPKED